MTRRAWAWIPILCCCLPASAAADLLWRAHGVAGIGLDGNPRERIEERYRRSDAFQRLEAGCGAEGGLGRGFWSGQLRWGSDLYVRERGETRHLLRGALGWRWEGRPGWRLAVEASASERLYPHAEGRDARAREIGLQGQAPAGRRALLLLQLRAGALYATAGERCGTWDGGDRRGLQGALEMQQPVSRTWRLLFRGEGGLVGYERPALEMDPAVAGGARELGEDQRDRSLLAACGCARLGVPLLRGTVGWRRVWSNSHGAGFGRMRVDGLLAWPLDRATRLVLTARWEPGEQRDEEERLVDCLIDLDDPDRGMSEFAARDALAVRCVREIGPGLSAELQAGWESSESRLPWERYEKTSLLFALRYELAP